MKRILLLIFLMIGFIYSMDIHECQVITSPGTYTLTDDLEFTYDDTLTDSMYTHACIIIDSSDVILDCEDNSITYVDSGSGHVLSVHVISDSNDVEITNCEFNSNYLLSFRSNGLTLSNNVFNTSTVMVQGDDNLIVNNEFIQTNNIMSGNKTVAEFNLFKNISTFSAMMVNSDNNTIQHNIFNNCTGINVIKIEIGNSNYFYNNTITNSTVGFYLGNTNDNVIEQNIVRNSIKGLQSLDSYYNWLQGNTFCDNGVSMSCEGLQSDEGDNVCDYSTMDGCGIECSPCLVCSDPDATHFPDDILTPSSVLVDVLGVTERYADQCTDDRSMIYEAVCMGSNYDLRPCPDGYHCEYDGGVAYCYEPSSADPCLDLDSGTDNPLVVGSSCINLTDDDMGSEYFDICDSGTLIEYECYSTGCQAITHECEDCVETSSGDYCDYAESECEDTDFDGRTSVVFDVFGIATDTLGGDHNDYCVDDEHINEAYCTISGIATQNIYSCPSYAPYCNSELDECVAVCNDDDPENNITYPGVCDDGEVHMDECYGPEHSIPTTDLVWQPHLRQVSCDDGECVYTNYEYCGCEDPDDAKCIAGICSCNEESWPPDIPDTDCSDPDGRDYHFMGTLIYTVDGTDRVYDDSCVSPSTVKEWICKSESVGVWPFSYTLHYPQYLVYDCPAGCEDGACLPMDYCYDSDAGDSDHYRVPGEVTLGTDVSDDYCLDDSTLVEQYCDYEVPVSEEHYCDHGCEENELGRGYCLSSPLSCDESDLEQDLYEVGVCNDDSASLRDSCLLDGSLKQYYCDGDHCLYEISECPTGEVCSEGRCVDFTCQDIPDFGIDYFTYSTCYGWSSDGEDQCVGGLGSDVLREFYCEDNECHSEDVACPSGVCRDGECIGCDDSDFGQDQNVYGECYSDSNDLNDSCTVEGKVLEAFCDHGSCRAILMTCPRDTACVDGSCVAGGCSDPDGTNVYTKGTCESRLSTITDECDSSFFVNEAVCKDGECQYIKRSCPVGYGCKNGHCVKGGYVKPVPVSVPWERPKPDY